MVASVDVRRVQDLKIDDGERPSLLLDPQLLSIAAALSESNFSNPGLLPRKSTSSDRRV
jgi:hypothetical protein